jgi:chloramphenicol-sensitive protein RarD
MWAVFSDQVLQASLGYFINPLVNVLLGFIFLRERLRPLQVVSVLLATIGVVILTVSYGQFPWIALTLAASFGLYGLLRKVAPVDGVTGLTVETTFALPVALGYLIHLGAEGQRAFGSGSMPDDVLLFLAGAVTAVPLLWFTNAARRLRLATLGFIQYLAPSLQFILAVVVFNEPLTRPVMITFACIWAALILYTVDSVREAREGQSRAGPAE